MIGKVICLTGALVAALLIGIGCIEIEEELTISKDGSGTVKATFALSEDLVKMIESAKKMGEESGAPGSQGDEDLPLTKQDVEKKFKKEGVEVTQFSKEAKEGKVRISYTLSFKNINLVRDNEGLEKIEFTRDESGNIIFQRGSGFEEIVPEESKDADTPAEMKEFAEQMRKAMLEQLKGLKAKFTVTLPNGIKESNADTTKGASATWEYNIEKAQKLVKEKKSLTMKAVFPGDGVTFKLEKPGESPEKQDKPPGR